MINRFIDDLVAQDFQPKSLEQKDVNACFLSSTIYNSDPVVKWDLLV